MKYILVFAYIVLVSGCGKNLSNITSGSGGSGGSGGTVDAGSGNVYPPQPSNFRFLLKDKVLDEAKNVNVNILKVELIGEGESTKPARLVLAENIGMVDLLTLRNGVLKALGDVKLPKGAKIHQMRFILGDGNHVVKNDGSLCALQTPSAQQSGVKILFTNSLSVEDGYTYSITLDFDVERSVVLKGNGGCLLKPVIKVETAERKPYTEGSSTEQIPTSGESDGSFSDATQGNDDIPITDSSAWL